MARLLIRAVMRPTDHSLHPPTAWSIIFIMNVVHVITRLIVGGAQENTLLTCEGLAARGHDVTLLAGPTTGPEGSLVSRAARGGYRFEEVPDLVRRVSPWHDTRALIDLLRRFKALRPELVHTHSSKAGILGRVAAHQAGVPILVHTVHGMSFNRTQPWPVRRAYACAEAHCAEYTRAMVSVADAMTTQCLAHGIGRREQFVTLRSGMEVDPFDPARHDPSAARRHWGVPADAIVVGTVARLFVHKGYEPLIKIMDRVAREESRLHFLWVGDGANRRDYESELERRGLRPRVTLTGLIPPEDMPIAFAAMDLLAHTSQWEGLPRAVVQALLMERPAVAFDIDGTPEVVEPQRTGLLVPLNDLDAFAEAVLRLARDDELRHAMGREGRARCIVAFDHRLMVSKLDELYARLRSE